MKLLRPIAFGALLGKFREAGNYGAGLADQGAGAIASLAALLVVGRLLGPEALGLYTILFSIVLFLRQLIVGVLLEGFPVIAASVPSHRRQEYFAVCLWFAAAALIGSAALLGVGIFMTGRAGWHSIDGIVAPLAFASISNLLFCWRRVYYAKQQAWYAALQNLAYLLVLTGALILLRDRLSLNTVFAAMALSALAVLLGQAWLWRKTLFRCSPSAFKRELKEHVFFGKWSCAGAPFQWAYNGGFAVLIGATLGVGSVGIVKAIDFLLMPYRHWSTAAFSVMVPAAAKFRQDQGAGAFKRWFWARLAVMGAGGFAYSALIIVFGEAAVQAIFGAAFVFDQRLLAVLAVLPILQGLTVVVSVALLASRRPDVRFFSFVVPVAVAWPLTYYLSQSFGLLGAAIGWSVSLAVHLAVTVVGFKLSQRPGAQTMPPNTLRDLPALEAAEAFKR
jgi:O-antigen/teichoic acid export membrane protein